jgi:hypothetical protein
MPAHIKESDWKVFKEVRADALERFCKRILSEMQRAANDQSRTAHQRFLAVYKLMDQRDEEIASAFNDFRRSTASLQLGIMYSLGLVEEGELTRFSPEIQDVVKALYAFRRGR